MEKKQTRQGRYGSTHRPLPEQDHLAPNTGRKLSTDITYVSVNVPRVSKTSAQALAHWHIMGWPYDFGQTTCAVANKFTRHFRGVLGKKTGASAQPRPGFQS